MTTPQFVPNSLLAFHHLLALSRGAPLGGGGPPVVVPSSSSSVSSSSSYAGPQGEDESATLERTKLSKERNREHAKKTRLRKKAFMDQLKSKVMVLQREAAALQQKLEERQTASILLTFSGTSSSSASSSSASISSSSSSASSSSSSFVPIAADDNEYSRGAGSDSERSVSARVTRGHSTAAAASSASAADASGPGSGSGELSPTALKGNIIEQLRTKVRREAKQAPPALLLPPPSSLLQKRLRSASVTSQSGDEGDGYDDDLEWDGQGEEDAGDDGAEQSTAPRGASAGEDLASYKKERNRMHAKLTRDRKKLFTCRLQQMIGALERQNADMRQQLVDDAPGHDREPTSSSLPPPMPASPQLGASPDPSS